MTTTTPPRTPRPLFTNGLRPRHALLVAVLSVAVLGCVDADPPALGAETESSDELGSSDASDDEGEPILDLASSGETGDGDGDAEEAGVCGDGVLSDDEQCDVGIDESWPCADQPGSFVCKPDCTQSDAFCDCTPGTEGCQCNTERCENGLTCRDDDDDGLFVCQPYPQECIEPGQPCIAVETCCDGLHCAPDDAGTLICQ